MLNIEVTKERGDVMRHRAPHCAALLAIALITCGTWAQPVAADIQNEEQTLVIVDRSRTVQAQHLPEDFAYDGSVDEWRDKPPTGTLETPLGSVTIWIGEGEDALIVAGQLRDQSDAGTRTKAATKNPPHIDVELASVASVRLPLIYMEGQHSSPLRGPADCIDDPSNDHRYDAAKCRAWFAELTEYRKRLKALFVRRTDPSDHRDRDLFSFLADNDEQRAIASEFSARDPIDVKWALRGGTRSFELSIPWRALPAADDLRLSAIYLALHLGTSDRDAARTFWRVALPAVRDYRLTRCGTRLFTAHQGQALSGFYLPMQQTTVAATFAFIPEEYYQPQGRSPRLASTHYLDEEVSPGRYLCAPILAYSNGAALTLYANGDDAPLQHPQDAYTGEVHPDWNGVFEWRDVDHGNLLVRFGPTESGSINGRGQCGACPRVSIAFWYIDRNEPSFGLAYDAYYVLNSANDEKADITVSDDWRRVDVDDVMPTVETGADGKPTVIDEHNREHWCLVAGAHKYDKCAETPSESR